MKKRIIRSAETKGNLIKIDKPAFLSLVGKPANQRPFPVIRSADAPKGRIVRTRRGDNAVMMLEFPEGYSEDDVKKALSAFGMDGYVVAEEAGRFHAYRNDLQSVAIVRDANPSRIRITSDGITAMVDQAMYQPKPAQAPAKGVTVSSFEFDAKSFDNEKIVAWMQRNAIDICSEAIENSSNDVISVSRKEITEGTEVRRMEVEPGVVAVIHRSEGNDVPDAVSGVVEAAYGCYGWGQLDFNANLADRAFCEAYEEGMYALRNVIENVMFYSDLPLDTRKTLVLQCLQQFGAFISDAIDTLPRQVLQLTSRAALPQMSKQEKEAMPIDKEAAQKELDAIVAKREADEAAAAAPAAAAPAAEAAPAVQAAPAAEPVAAAVVEAPVTRSELATLIAEGVTAALAARDAAAAAAPAAVVAAPVAAVAAPVEAVRSAEPAPVAAPAAAPVVSITRDDIAALLKAELAPVAERLEKIEGTTVVRSAQGDGKPAEAKKESVFRGAFSGIGGGRSEQ